MRMMDNIDFLVIYGHRANLLNNKRTYCISSNGMECFVPRNKFLLFMDSNNFGSLI